MSQHLERVSLPLPQQAHRHRQLWLDSGLAHIEGFGDLVRQLLQPCDPTLSEGRREAGELDCIQEAFQRHHPRQVRLEPVLVHLSPGAGRTLPTKPSFFSAEVRDRTCIGRNRLDLIDSYARLVQNTTADHRASLYAPSCFSETIWNSICLHVAFHLRTFGGFLQRILSSLSLSLVCEITLATSHTTRPRRGAGSKKSAPRKGKCGSGGRAEYKSRPSVT